jgi:Fibronectin type III domain
MQRTTLDVLRTTLPRTTGTGTLRLSSPSAASSTFVTPHAPDVPSITNVSASATSVTVSFTAPTSNGGSPITGYQATCSSSNGGTTRTSAFGLTSPLTVSGLTIGKAYTCTVRARNALGLSLSSSPSKAVIIRTGTLARLGAALMSGPQPSFAASGEVSAVNFASQFPRGLTTWKDAELLGLALMQYLGYSDAALTKSGSDGEDVPTLVEVR